MRILIVSAFFPPQNAIASLRPYSWAKYWSKCGHEVVVLTTSKKLDKTSLNLDCSSFSVIEVPLKIPFRKANEIVNDTKNKSNDTESKRRNVFFFMLTLLKNGYKKFISRTGCFLVCRFPDWHDFWIKKAVKLIQIDSFDALVTTGGPYSIHKAGLYFRKKGWRGEWICDWRDLFTKNHLYPGLKIFHGIEKKLENKFHENANYITTVSDQAADILKGITNTPIETIYNGYDEDDFEFLFKENRRKNSRLIISYLGSIYKGFRDPSPLFQAVSELNYQGKITSDRLIIKFAGDSSADLTELAKSYGIEDYYEYLGFVSREESLELQYNSDMVLFLEYENPSVKGVLTGKLFEYLYIARNIIAVGCTNKTTAGALIEACKAGLCFGNDVEAIKNYIMRAIDYSMREDSEKNIEEIKKYSRELQAKKMLELLGKK